MHPHLSVLTLAVLNLQTSLDFYCQGLGFKSKGIIGQEYENGAVAFIELQSGLKLALRPQQSLSLDSDLQLSPSLSDWILTEA
jgi:catechol 2,3-dioxygenase-like lactoylglutathione lyase family enzyme